MKEELRELISETDFRIVAFFIIAFSVLFAVTILLLFIFNTTNLNSNLPLDTSIFADYGSVVGGLTAAILSLASVLLLIQTINQQIKENKLQDVESRFFEMINLHRDNVSEFESKGRQGKNVVIEIFDEYQELYKSVSAYYLETRHGKKISDRPREVAEIAFHITFFGLDNNSFPELERNIKDIMQNDTFYEQGFKPMFLDSLIEEYRYLKEANEDRIKSNRKYLPHDGHQSRLGHYFRHLFQSVNYINDKPSKLLSYEDKYSFVKTLRAQLSTHEQALLFINSLTSLGREWELAQSDMNKKLITKYNLIKNLPLGFVGELRPQDYYPLVNYEFNFAEPHFRIYLQENFS